MKEGKQEMLNEQKMDSFSISCFYGYGSFKSSQTLMHKAAYTQSHLSRFIILLFVAAVFDVSRS